MRLIKAKTQAALITTMIDFDKLKGKGFPGYEKIPVTGSVYDQVAFLESAVKQDIAHRIFPSYFTLHAFEAMLFAGPDLIVKQFPGLSTSTKKEFIKIKAEFDTPEHINHDRSPAQRIINLIPQYEKTVYGLTIAEKIGLPAIRVECRHFNEWLTRLENL